MSVSATIMHKPLRAGVFLLLGAITAASYAAPPRMPLPNQGHQYAFDLPSPTVQAGFLAASDALEFATPVPNVAIPGPLLGLTDPADDLDALSASNAFLPPSASFVLLFSVDRLTVGVEPPDPFLVSEHVPYNVLDQAMREHAAGDQYMSLIVFSAALDGTPARPEGARPSNNSLVRNNFDEGGNSFSAQPPTHSRDNPTRDPQDDVNATASLEQFLDRSLWNVYFTATGESPSLWPLSQPEPPSGANIFFAEGPFNQRMTTLYAAAIDLGLDVADDIDGLVVLDRNQNRLYDAGDTVLFSLTPDSPSLAIIPGASGSGAAADIFFAQPSTGPMVLALASDLGLGAATDNIDALDFQICSNAFACALDWGIRFYRGDVDDDADIDRDDFEAWAYIMTGPDNGPCPPPCTWLDFDEDDDSDLADFSAFQRVFGLQP
jgi:hypothetical protein